jgi:hypothetical protein
MGAISAVHLDHFGSRSNPEVRRNFHQAHVHDACRSGIVVPKPAAPQQLVSAIETLLALAG